MNLRSKILLSAFFFIAAFCGCARTDSPLSSDTTIALRQARELLPMGTPEIEAKEILKKNGFEVSRPQSERNDLLVGTYIKGRKKWEVCATITNGQAFVFSVNLIEREQ